MRRSLGCGPIMLPDGTIPQKVVSLGENWKVNLGNKIRLGQAGTSVISVAEGEWLRKVVAASVEANEVLYQVYQQNPTICDLLSINQQYHSFMNLPDTLETIGKANDAYYQNKPQTVNHPRWMEVVENLKHVIGTIAGGLSCAKGSEYKIDLPPFPKGWSFTSGAGGGEIKDEGRTLPSEEYTIGAWLSLAAVAAGIGFSIF